jgi:hypothetical protein
MAHVPERQTGIQTFSKSLVFRGGRLNKVSCFGDKNNDEAGDFFSSHVTLALSADPTH